MGTWKAAQVEMPWGTISQRRERESSTYLEQQQRTRQGVSRVTEGVQKQYLHGTARPSAGQNGMGRTKKMEMVVFAAAGDWLLR